MKVLVLAMRDEATNYRALQNELECLYSPRGPRLERGHMMARVYCLIRGKDQIHKWRANLGWRTVLLLFRCVLACSLENLSPFELSVYWWFTSRGAYTTGGYVRCCRWPCRRRTCLHLVSTYVSSDPITSGQLSRGLFAPCLSTRPHMSHLCSDLLSFPYPSCK